MVTLYRTSLKQMDTRLYYLILVLQYEDDDNDEDDLILSLKSFIKFRLL